MIRTRSSIGIIILAALLSSRPAASTAPATGAVVPSAGSGTPQVFTSRYTAAASWKNLRLVRILIGTGPSLEKGVCAEYQIGGGLFYLLEGTARKGGLRPGSSDHIRTSRGDLFLRNTRVMGAGTSLRVQWHLGFRAPLADRTLAIYLQAVDKDGAGSGWVKAGRWLVSSRDIPVAFFPADNPWNKDISKAAVHPDSDKFISSIGSESPLHPDFGTGWQGVPIGIPYVIVAKGQPKVPVSFYYADESDPGPYPIPAWAPIEGGPAADGDRHVLVIDRDGRRLYELYDARKTAGGWRAGSGAIFDLTSNRLRPEGWTSADAAGLPILPGLVRFEEVAAGRIDHALRFTAPRTRRGYIHPATHFASDSRNPSLPPMGLRVRLKAGLDITAFPPRVRVILRALRTYGMFVADNGAPWYLSGAPHDDWDDEELRSLSRLRGRDFEAVWTGPVIGD